MKYLILSLLCINVHAARLTDGKVKHTIKDNQIEITIEKGFHVNQKAPMSFKFYVCDDKNSVCEQQEIKPTVKK